MAKQQWKQARQGDVFIERVPARSVPPDTKPVKRDGGRFVLAYGEATGHAHAIHDPEVEVVVAGNGETYVRVKALAHLTHEEHTQVPLPPGTYRVRRQREYSPEEIRQVAD